MGTPTLDPLTGTLTPDVDGEDPIAAVVGVLYPLELATVGVLYPLELATMPDPTLAPISPMLLDEVPFFFHGCQIRRMTPTSTTGIPIFAHSGNFSNHWTAPSMFFTLPDEAQNIESRTDPVDP